MIDFSPEEREELRQKAEKEREKNKLLNEARNFVIDVAKRISCDNNCCHAICIATRKLIEIERL